MKIALITDLHWGCKNDLPLFYDYFGNFYKDLTNYLVLNSINTLFILGDVFDKRKVINFKTLDSAKKILFDELKENNINVHIIVGNHDIHYRESLELSSPILVLNEYTNIAVYDKPKVIKIDNTSISMIPWICKANKAEITEFMTQNNTDLCFGHFDIKNFQMYKGSVSYNGMERNCFEKYELVCSGHFHTRSSDSNITYLGSPYEMKWNDCDDPRGFHIFDTTTRQLDFIQNNHKMFYVLTWNDGCDFDTSILKDKFVKVIVTSKNDVYLFEKFIESLNCVGCYDVKVVEDITETSSTVDEDVDIADTMDVVTNYIHNISGLEIDIKNKVNVYMKELYLEAINDCI